MKKEVKIMLNRQKLAVLLKEEKGSSDIANEILSNTNIPKDLVSCVVKYLQEMCKENDRSVEKMVNCLDLMEVDETNPELGSPFDVVAEDYEKKKGNVSWVKSYNRFKESVSPREMNRICYNFKRELMFT